jgi:hypothetical protein
LSGKYLAGGQDSYETLGVRVVPEFGWRISGKCGEMMNYEPTVFRFVGICNVRWFFAHWYYDLRLASGISLGRLGAAMPLSVRADRPPTPTTSALALQTLGRLPTGI